MVKSDIAVNIFKSGYNCAQAVLHSFASEIDLDKNLAMRIANGFGGGMGRKQETCGAVSGAVMVLGAKYGRNEGDGKEKQEAVYAKVQQLIDGFKARHGTVNCREILGGCDLLTEAGQKSFKDDDLIATCHACVRTACELLEELL